MKLVNSFASTANAAVEKQQLKRTDTVQPELSEANEQVAKYIAMVIRNAIEDFHCEHLTDEQTKQLNPLIRNAVATALHAFEHYERIPAARRYVDHQFRMIPAYWEKPELQEGYVKKWQRDGQS